MKRLLLAFSIFALLATGAFAQAKKVYTVYTNQAQGANSPAMMSDTVIGKIISDKTGVDLKFIYYVGDANTKIGVMIASGDYPDIVLASGGTAPTWLDSGAFIPLDTLLKAEGKDIDKVYGETWKRNRQKDGKIYTIPAFSPIGTGLPRTLIGDGFALPKAAYEASGFPKIETLEQYFAWIEKYVKENPTIDGQKTIGFEILRDDWRNSIQWMYENLGAYPGDGRAVVDLKTKKVIMRDIAPDMKKLLQFLNVQHAKGLIDPESFVQKYDQYVAKLASGRVVGFWDATWEFGPAADALTKAGKEGQTWYQLPNITWKKGDPLTPNIVTRPSGDGTAITTKAKDPKGIMKFLNALVSEEMQTLVQWGVKGTHYTVDAKGKYVRTVKQMQDASDSIINAKVGLGGVGGYPWPSLRGTWPNGNTVFPSDSPEVAAATLDDWDKKFVKAWGLKVPGDLYNNTMVTNYTWTPLWTINWANYPGKYDQVYNDAYALSEKWFAILITGPVDKFESNWTTYVNEVNKLDIKGLVGTLQKEMDYRIANY